LLLRHKVAIVTGGWTGIGKAIGTNLARNGARVAIASRNPAHLEAAKADFEKLGLPFLGLPMDLRKKEDIQRTVASALSLGVTPEQFKEQAVAGVPIRRFLAPDEVAELVCYLASDLAKGITGQAINICGGQTML